MLDACPARLVACDILCRTGSGFGTPGLFFPVARSKDRILLGHMEVIEWRIKTGR